MVGCVGGGGGFLLSLAACLPAKRGGVVEVQVGVEVVLCEGGSWVDIYGVEVAAPGLVVVVLGGGTLKNVGGPLYVCGALSVRAYVCVSTSIFQGVGSRLGLWAGHWRISVGGHPTRRKS